MLFIPWVDTYPAKGLKTLEQRVQDALYPKIMWYVRRVGEWDSMPAVERIEFVLLERSWFYPYSMFCRGRVIKDQACLYNPYHKPDCTFKTAMRRLIASGRVEKKLVSRGWYRYYAYKLVL